MRNIIRLALLRDMYQLTMHFFEFIGKFWEDKCRHVENGRTQPAKVYRPALVHESNCLTVHETMLYKDRRACSKHFTKKM